MIYLRLRWSSSVSVCDATPFFAEAGTWRSSTFVMGLDGKTDHEETIVALIFFSFLGTGRFRIYFGSATFKSSCISLPAEFIFLRSLHVFKGVQLSKSCLRKNGSSRICPFSHDCWIDPHSDNSSPLRYGERSIPTHGHCGIVRDRIGGIHGDIRRFVSPRRLNLTTVSCGTVHKPDRTKFDPNEHLFAIG